MILLGNQLLIGNYKNYEFIPIEFIKLDNN
jgi:hypothetical protein